MATVQQPLQSPLQRRSDYLSRALESMSQPQRISGYGDLGARLLAQGLLQAAQGRTEKAIGAEASNADLARRQRIASAIGGSVEGTPQEVGNGRIGNPLEGLSRLLRREPAQPVSAPSAPMTPGPVEGASMPSVGQPAPQAQAPSVPPAFAQQVQALLAQGPEGVARAEQLVNQFQNQQAMLAMAPEAIRNDPQLAFAYANNPEAVAESIGYQYRPQVVAEGGAQNIAGSGQTFRNPRTREFGDQLVRDTEQGYEVLGSRQPTFAEQTARISAERPQAVTTATGADTRLVGPTGEVVNQFAGRAPVAPPSAVNTELQGRIDSTRRETIPTVGRMRELLSSRDVITGFGANARLDAARALAALGNEDAKRQVAATQEYQNLSGQLRVALAKSLGANPSNADILLLEKITAGDIGQSPEALLATIGQAEERATSLMGDLERQLGGTRQGGSRPRARNPQTGQVVEFDGQSWVPVG